ncbi:MAG: thiamine pyrophosphate-dependent enzyme [Elusimicrobia bacterium]|nr:thiamine pyrophosphate-dependent enzyme [Elusimicrobiota bacterium]
MRSSTFGIIPGISKKIKTDITLEMFRRICIVRYFELNAIESVKTGFIEKFIYLSSGEETIPAAMSLVIPKFSIFSQHRCHAAYLSFGGDPVKLRDELLGLSTGTSGGRAGSNCIQCHENNITMFGHHGLIGENVPLGVGAALGSGKPVVCFFGDGAAEEDYVFASMGFAATHKLPVLFVCEDNNLSILTTLSVRRSWSMTNVAKAFGMPGIDVTDDPWTIYKKTQELKNNLPAFINIYTCRAYWHNSIGTDGPPEWDRFHIVKNELKKIGLLKKAEYVENTVKMSMEKLWDKKLLQKLLKK